MPRSKPEFGGRRTAEVPEVAPAAKRRLHARNEPAHDAPDPAAIRTEWNDLATELGLPPCRALVGRTAQLLAARLRDPRWRASWREALARLPESGLVRRGHAARWLNLAWFLRPDTVAALLEGRFDWRVLAGLGGPHS